MHSQLPRLYPIFPYVADGARRRYPGLWAAYKPPPPHLFCQPDVLHNHLSPLSPHTDLLNPFHDTHPPPRPPSIVFTSPKILFVYLTTRTALPRSEWTVARYAPRSNWALATKPLIVQRLEVGRRRVLTISFKQYNNLTFQRVLTICPSDFKYISECQCGLSIWFWLRSRWVGIGFS